MKKIFLPIAAALLLLAGCSHDASGDRSSEVLPQEIDTTAAVGDQRIYQLGYDHAVEMLDTCLAPSSTSSQRLEQGLLDLRARIHIISTQVSPAAASDYARGVTDAIRATSDTLATSIL